MKLSRTMFFTMLTAGFTVTTSIVPATAAQFAINAPSVVEQAGNQDVILAAVRNNSRPAPRFSQRSQTRSVSTSTRRNFSSSTGKTKTQSASTNNFRKPKTTQTTNNNSGNRNRSIASNNNARKSTGTSNIGANNKAKNNIAQTGKGTGNSRNRITQNTQQNGKGKATTASNGASKFTQPSGLTKTNPIKTTNQLSKISTRPPGSIKPAVYQSKLTSTFKSKHKQMPVLGKGRQIPPNWKHNPNMLAGLKGYKNNYKPYWFKSGGQTWFRYYYTYAVAGVAYWYWCNLTPSEVEEQRVVLTSYTSGDCNCETPPPSSPECDCDDDDCSAED